MRTECKRKETVNQEGSSVLSDSCIHLVAGADVMLTMWGVSFDPIWESRGKACHREMLKKAELLSHALNTILFLLNY